MISSRTIAAGPPVYEPAHSELRAVPPWRGASDRLSEIGSKRLSRALRAVFVSA
jgi:hypothetical protein